MKIEAIELKNIKSFKTLPKTEVSKNINVFVGENNSGKSTILQTILNLQEPTLTSHNITRFSNSGQASIYFEKETTRVGKKLSKNVSIKGNRINFRIYGPNMLHKTILEFYGKKKDDSFTSIPIERFKSHQPDHYIVQHLSIRKVADYSTDISEDKSISVSNNYKHLFAKIDKIVNPSLEIFRKYQKYCIDIFGMEISMEAVKDGKQAVQYLTDNVTIPMTEMGQGVPNLLALIIDLCSSNNKIFLIEEIENDIHPKALKAILSLIIEQSENNQFFITTHSNIVLKYLGGVTNSKIFRVNRNIIDNKHPKLHFSSLDEISSEEQRKEVLEEIGYDFYDFDLWKAWLILEESSAERLIKDHFIPWYTPSLRHQLRTFSARSLSEVKPKFQDFNRLFVFLNLQETYKNRVWVCIDDGAEEAKTINELKRIYCTSGWKDEQFRHFSEHDFEKYYPERFQEQIINTLAIADQQKKRKAKKDLLIDVLTWTTQNEEQAKQEFEVSAIEVITLLKEIEETLIVK